MSKAVQEHFMSGVSLHQLGKLEEAKLIYEQILKTQPKHADALHLLGVIASQTGKPDQAVELISQAIAAQSNNPGFYINLGNAFQALNQFELAIASFDKAIKLQPNIAEAYFNRGNAQQALNQLDSALLSFDRAVVLKKDYAEAHNNRGRVLQALGRLEDALLSYEEAIHYRPHLAEAHHNRGLVLSRLDRLNEAMDCYLKAIQAKSDYKAPYVALSDALHSAGRIEEALAVLERYLLINPNDPILWNRRGNFFVEINNFEKALDSYNHALQLDRNYCESYINIGNIFFNKNQHRQSIDLYDQALAINPGYADAYHNRGISYHCLFELELAIKSFDQAIHLNPDKAVYFYARAGSWLLIKRYDEAIKDLECAFALDPEYELLLGLLIHTKQKINDWTSFMKDVSNLRKAIDLGLNSVPCFAGLAIFDSLEVHYRIAKSFMGRSFPENKILGHIEKRPRANKIKIGYFSADFRDHPVSFLMAGVFEKHLRDQFEVFAFASGSDVDDGYRTRIKSLVDHFININLVTDVEVARLSRRYEIDIAIDLGGHTQDSRFGVFAYRAAPIQLSYIGYLGTMGSDYYDYLLADHVLIPEVSRSFYSEKIAYLPSYQANDSRRHVADKAFSRKELYLPDDAFVFCCFNNNYKILPSTFDLWMNILKAVPSAVLVLYVGHPTARESLANEARQRGVDPVRVIFAERLPYDQHLARYRAMDLFLDTLPYNAGATASDALWAGLPVLTQMGESFASRYAASLLMAIGLSELITDTPKAYEELAIHLATHPERLKSIKEKLQRNRLTTPLFNTAKFTQSLEASYRAMYDRYQADLPPDHLFIQEQT